MSARKAVVVAGGDKMPSASTSIEIDAPPETVMAVITDFANYPKFLAEMSEAVVLRRDGKVWVVKFAVSVVRRLEYTLRLEQTSDTAMSWTYVEGAFKANKGGWNLEPLDGGKRTKAGYTIELEIGMFVPGSVMKTILEKSLPSTMASFKKESERRT